MSAQIAMELAPELGQMDYHYPKSVLGKAHLILGAFDERSFRFKLSELSLRAGLPKPTTHRLAQELVQWGLLEKHGEWYELGTRIFEMGHRTPMSKILRDTARPHLVELFAVTRLTSHIVIRSGFDAYFVEKVAGRDDDNGRNDAGQRAPLHATAAGKLLLATEFTDQGVVAYSRGRRMERLTGRTVTEPERLLAEVQAIRAAGYALDFEECMPGYSSLAVVVPALDGRGRSVISVTRRSSVLAAPQCLGPLRDAATHVAIAIESVSRRGRDISR